MASGEKKVLDVTELGGSQISSLRHTDGQEDEDLSCPSDESIYPLDSDDADLSIGEEDGLDKDEDGVMNEGLMRSNYAKNMYGSVSVADCDVNGDNVGGDDDGVVMTEETLLLPNSHVSAAQQARPFTLETSHLSMFASLTFQWFVPLLTLGNSKAQLDPEDLASLPLPPSCETQNVSEAFEYYWNREKEKFKRNQSRNTCKRKKQFTPSVARCLAYAFGRDFIHAGILKLIHDINVFVGPFVLHGLIQFLRDPNAPIQTGLMLTVAVTVSQTIMSFCLRHYFFKCYLVGLRTRTAIVVQVYKKALTLSSVERQRRTTGEIINFMSVDAQRIQDLTTYLHAIWYSFIQISLSIYFLWQQLGPSCLGGVAVIIVMVPVTKIIAAWIGRLQKRLMEARDRRVEINNEVLGSMKVIKLQAWEDSFQKSILSMRKVELKHLVRYVLATSFSIMMWTAVPLFVALATFTAYIFLGNTLDIANALTALVLFDILKFPLFMLPQVVNNLVEASISLERVKDFLMSEDFNAVSEGAMTDVGIQIKGASFVYESKKPKFREAIAPGTSDETLMQELHDYKWEITLLKAQLKDAEQDIRDLSKVEDVDTATAQHCESPLSESDEGVEDSLLDLLALRRIDFCCDRGELVAVVGHVGSGKSTFINSILGEVKALSGTVAARGRLALFPQSPFIMNASLQNNVTFGSQSGTFDREKYDKAISICALEHDISLLSDGDQTEIGEKGITLSGGQKARVAMARAVYHDADIYLLDDPLAAVDAHVGKHIFQKCIVDELLLGHVSGSEKKSSVILVTNAIQYLSDPHVSKIMVLNGGKVVEVGTFSQLSSNPDSLFSSFLSIIEQRGQSYIQDGSSPSDREMEDKLASSTDQSVVGKIGATLTSFLSVASPSRIEARMSTQSEHSNKNTSVAKGVKRTIEPEVKSSTPLMTSELLEREKGHVDLAVYMAWAKAAGGITVGVLLFVGYATDQGVSIASKWWLTYWSRNGEENENKFLLIYAIINLVAVLTMFTRVIIIFASGIRASRSLFIELLDVVLRAPMSFFDTTPLGRIVNRFSKDIYTLDEKLVATMRSYFATLSNVFGTIIVVSYATPSFSLFLIPMLAFYVDQQVYFTKTYRELKRLDSVSRSPLFALLGETLDGISTIRAFKAEASLLQNLIGMVDTQQNAYYLTTAAQCWLAIRLELVGTLIIFATCICAVLDHPFKGGDEVFVGLAGLAISFSLSVTQSLSWSVRMGSDLEAHMVSVERIKQYCKIPSEAPHTLPIDQSLMDWPTRGEIVFSSAELRYRDNLPLVLKGLDIRIPSMCKVGVVGRTGAGKSTLMISLLRIVELCSGSIEIDGVDISKIGLKILRSRIAVIPQDPVLFSGTVRTNLDPFNEYQDDRLREVLQRVGLMRLERVSSGASLNSLPGSGQSFTIKSLHHEVSEAGSNFSVGQRQLLVIARALLCGAKIVIMDEATASVDADTDARIQRVMRTEFKGSTCITVAHRINTILDSDYILVMDDGRAAEFDTPDSLMQEGGLFKDLVDAWELGRNSKH